MVDDLEAALPPGAIPSDVADDIDVKISQGEFIVPANVVRFIGVEKLESMVQKATEKLTEMEGEGRMGQPSEEGEGGVVEPPAFAAGGLVAPEGMELKEYKGPNGETLLVPFRQGAPIIQVPEGYSEKTQSTKAQPTPQRGGLVTGQSSNEGTGYDPEKVGLNKDVSDWDVNDFNTHARSVSTPQGRIGNGIVGSIASIMGVGGVVNAAERHKGKQVTAAMDTMLGTGKDLKGNPLSPEQMESLKASKAAIANPEQPSIAEKVVGAGLGVAKNAFSGSGLVGSVAKEAAATASEKITGERNPVRGLIGRATEPIRDAIESTFAGRKEQKATTEEKDKTSSTNSTSSGEGRREDDDNNTGRSTSTSRSTSSGGVGMSGSAAPGRDN